MNMSIVRQEPWSLLQKFNNDINRVFGNAGLRYLDNDGSNVVTSHWTPAVDIKEEQDRYVLTADLPGVDPKDIEITMENGKLTIKGERHWKEQENRDGYQRVERIYGSFYRRFNLPDTVNAENITAKSNNGVLEVGIPKQEKELPRRIAVGG